MEKLIALSLILEDWMSSLLKHVTFRQFFIMNTVRETKTFKTTSNKMSSVFGNFWAIQYVHFLIYLGSCGFHVPGVVREETMSF